MPQHLFPCESCRNHVKASEQECPFCGAALPTDRVVAPTTAHLSRVALLAMSATVATASIASSGCSENVGSAKGTVDAAVDARADVPDAVMARDAYGGIPFDAGRDAGTDAMAAPAYGGPPPDESSDSGAP